MKNTEQQTNQEIGELITELLGKGYDVQLRPKCSWAEKPISVQVHDLVNRWTLRSQDGQAESLAATLGSLVDAARREKGEPSREDELEKMLLDDWFHAAAPPVEIGPDASCACGSKRPLKVKREGLLNVYWNGDLPTYEPPGITSTIKPGEIGRCPDCGKHYTF